MTSLPYLKPERNALLAAAQRIHILVVDDDEFFRGREAEILDEAGYCTLSAADGEEALILLKLGEFDLLLTDWQMPHLDGIELIRTLRAVGNLVPVLIVSGSITSSGTELPEDVRGEVAAWLPKVANSQEILTAVRSTLNSGNAKAA